MHNYSVGQNTKIPKSPAAKVKHVRDDSSLDRSSKLKSVQSCRRITTQQGEKFGKIADIFPKKQSLQKLLKMTKKSTNEAQKICLLKQNKYSSCKNIKNLNLSPSLNKKIQNYLHLFSPKYKTALNKNQKNLGQTGYRQTGYRQQSTNLMSKSTLKKVRGNKIDKTRKQQKITPFIIKPKCQLNDKHQKSQKYDKNKGTTATKARQQRVNTKPQCQSKSRHFKTLQNETISNVKTRNSNKIQHQSSKNGKKNADRSRMYHNVKMKTEQSMISCQSTPSQIFTHDIQFMELIGQGSFGKVYKALIKKTSQIVAIKKVHQDKNYQLREVEIISLLTGSQFIMRVLGTYISHQGQGIESEQYLNIVMKYYESDLYKEIQKNTLSNIEIKLNAYQIFRGLLYIHSKNICHRDIKPHNILTNNMSLALCDFGSAKVLKPEDKNLPYVCSRCYRAPELIFASTQYTTMIDIWSVGCVVLQMIHGSPFFVGNSSIDHLIEVIKVLGTPTKSQVKEMNPQYDLKDYKFPNVKSKPFAQIFPNTDPLLISLLEQIMIYSPKQRLNAAQALVHEYFDQLRVQGTYEKLSSKYELADFFDFTPEQLIQNQHLYGQLVPQWYCKTHCTYFQTEQIQKNNTLKYYFD